MRHALGFPDLELRGLGANLACQSGVVPDARNMAELSAIATSVEATFGMTSRHRVRGQLRQPRLGAERRGHRPDRRSAAGRSDPARSGAAAPPTARRPAHRRLHPRRRGDRGQGQAVPTVGRPRADGVRGAAAGDRPRHHRADDRGDRRAGRRPVRPAASPRHPRDRGQQRPPHPERRRSPRRGRCPDRVPAQLQRAGPGDDVAVRRQGAARSPWIGRHAANEGRDEPRRHAGRSVPRRAASRRQCRRLACWTVGPGQTTRTFCASSPFRPGATSNSTRCPSSRDL